MRHRVNIEPNCCGDGDADCTTEFENICRVTVSFAGVGQTTSGDAHDHADIGGATDPPDISPVADLQENPHTLDPDPECPISTIRPRCAEWNRDETGAPQEWELFPELDADLRPKLPTDGSTFLGIKLAAGQAGGGFTLEPWVYTMPTATGESVAQAGSYCFPCASFGDKTPALCSRSDATRTGTWVRGYPITPPHKETMLMNCPVR